MSDIKANPKHAIVASFIGTVLEWYDFFTYGTAAALVFPNAFFPKFDQFASVLASLAVFGVGFFARPVGGFVFAYFGDRYGRKISFAATLTLMGFATLAIGLLPTYAAIGLAAPFFLVLFRIFQGIALGGEYGAAVLCVTENVSSKRIGFFGSWTQAGVPAGMLLSASVFTLTQVATGHTSLDSGDWRIPFIFGGIVALIGVYVRIRLFETIAFSQAKPVRNPLVNVFLNSPMQIIGGILIRLPENASYYLVTVFLVSFGATQLGMDKTFLIRCLFVGSAAQFMSILFFGGLSDRIGIRSVLLAGLLIVTPCFWLVTQALILGDRGLLLAAFAVFLGFGHALLYAPQSAFFTRLFPVEVRYSGISAVTQISAVLAGGIAPFIGAYLTRGENLTNLVIYVGFLAVLGLVGLFMVRKSQTFF